MNDNLYNENSIESLSPLEFTRLRAGVYCGSTANPNQLLVEILSNAIDEFRLGHGDKIEVDIRNDIIRVRDYGQGFIVNSFREDGKTILEAAFSVLNTSGKYREDGTYEGTALGSFGIGSKITTYLSHWLNVVTHRDGKYETINFKEGVFNHRAVGNSNEPSGTIVEWQPSEEFFDTVIIDTNPIKELFKTTCCLCPGLTIILNNNGEETKYFSKNGLNDLVDETIKEKEIINNRFRVNWAEGKNRIDLILTYTSNYSLTIVPYVNTGLTDTGSHITQIKSLITREFNKYAKEKKWLKEKDENLSGEDIQNGMYIVFNVTAPGVAYDAQVKTRVTKIDMKPFMQPLADAFVSWLAANEKDAKTMVDKALQERKAREAAKKARDNVRDSGPKSKKKALLNLPSKLVDCWSKDRSKCELFIAEGDSAASGLVEGRDGEIHAIFPIRGKIISAYKNDSEKIFANQEVNNLIKALGLDLDVKTKKLIYDTKKLRYGKIFMAADGDPDGASIRNLLIEMIWWLCPELILNGHLYTTMPPLFRVTTKKNEYIYLKDASALEKYKKEHANEKFLINRNKGLGEQDSSELSEALLDEKTRNVAQISINDVKEAERMIEILLGSSVPPRREFLLAHEEEANDNE